MNSLRLPEANEPPIVEVFESRNGRAITGAVVSADRSSWAPVLDGVVAFSEMSAGSPPASSDDLAKATARPPLFAGHRDWMLTADPDVARVPFGPIADRLLAEAGRLASLLKRGALVIVTGDDSGWGACSVAALLPDQSVIAVIDKAGPLGLAGCRRWLGASDAPGNLTVIVSDGGTISFGAAGVAAVLGMTALDPGVPCAPPIEAAPAVLHALIDPKAPIDLDRARIGERLLSDIETKVLYWASRAASVAVTAERMGQSPADIVAILATLHAEGFVRLQRLAPAMARLHVFLRTGESPVANH